MLLLPTTHSRGDPRYAHGERRRILQADQTFYLCPPRAELLDAGAMVVGEHHYPDVVLERVVPARGPIPRCTPRVPPRADPRGILALRSGSFPAGRAGPLRRASFFG